MIWDEQLFKKESTNTFKKLKYLMDDLRNF